jgi:hypothetical protein
MPAADTAMTNAWICMPSSQTLQKPRKMSTVLNAYQDLVKRLIFKVYTRFDKSDKMLLQITKNGSAFKPRYYRIPATVPLLEKVAVLIFTS